MHLLTHTLVRPFVAFHLPSDTVSSLRAHGSNSAHSLAVEEAAAVGVLVCVCEDQLSTWSWQQVGRVICFSEKRMDTERGKYLTETIKGGLLEESWVNDGVGDCRDYFLSVVGHLDCAPTLCHCNGGTLLSAVDQYVGLTSFFQSFTRSMVSFYITRTHRCRQLYLWNDTYASCCLPDQWLAVLNQMRTQTF